MAEDMHLLMEIMLETREEVMANMGQEENDTLHQTLRGAPLHLTNMPKDPLAEDFGHRINRYSADDPPPELRPVHASSARQSSLF